MAIGLRVLLIAGAALMMIFVLWKIRKSQLLTSDAIFWFVLSLVFIILAIFPQIAYAVSYWLGVESPANFIFLATIAVLIVRELFDTVQISQLKDKLTCAVQNGALEKNREETEDASER